MPLSSFISKRGCHTPILILIQVESLLMSMALKGKVNLVEVKYDRAFTEESMEACRENIFSEGGWMDTQKWSESIYSNPKCNTLHRHFAYEIDNHLNMILFTVESLAEFVRAKKMVEDFLEFEEEA